MAKKNKFCPWCGAVMRPKASFCHSCGHSLDEFKGGKKTSAKTQKLNAEMLAAANRETAVAENIAVTDEVENESELTAPTALESTNGATPETVEDIPPTEAKPTEAAVETESNQTEAAPKKKIRRTKRRYVSQTEYVWEESDAPNWSILLFSVLSLVLVLILLWLGNFWR